MPISPIVLQRRHAELGRIRLGNQVATGNGRTRPNKLAAFRFTSPSQRYIEDLALLYGGQAQPWDNNGVPSWEVFTTATSIPVIAVKGGLSQWMETWSGGGCVHRCDGEHNTLTDSPCDPNDPQHQAAKPTTRLSVMLPELEAIGVWRMESHGWNAAAEIPAVAELAQYVGDLVPANLHLVERRTVKHGQTSRFVVPVLDLQIGTARLKEIVAEKSGSGGGPAIAAGPAAGAAAIEAGPAAARDAAGEAYADALQQVADATTLPELAGIWDALKDAKLVGSESPASPAREKWVAAWKARAHAIKDAQEPAASPPDGAGQPVEDDPAAADAAWGQLLKAAGELDPPMTTSQVQEWFTETIGVAPSAASVGELQHAVGLVAAKSGAPA